MKILTYPKAGKNVGQLHDELLADNTVGPQIQGTWDSDEGAYENVQHQFHHNSNYIYIIVPAAVATEDVNAVVDAHVPQ